ncbi:tetratricopeptide repeat protein [bacterium]|nr:tetratricopeptide repeat protein [bacterium]
MSLRPHIAPLLLLLLLSACGTRSIVVPVQRPAAFDFHGCDRVAVAPIPYLPMPDSLTMLLHASLDRQLAPTLAESDSIRFVAAKHTAMSLLTRRGTVDLGVATSLARRERAQCLLICELLTTSFQEEILEAEIQSMADPGKVKRVRQGRANAHCRVMLVDVEARNIPFVENLSVEARRETHATEKDPPPIETKVIAEDLAQKVTETLRAATEPVTDRELVTFLVDGAYPAIEEAITLAEAGQWEKSEALLRGMLDEANVGENTDILWYNLGLTLQYQQNFSGAMKAFRQALSLRDRSRYHHAVDNLLRAEQEYLDTLKQ